MKKNIRIEVKITRRYELEIQNHGLRKEYDSDEEMIEDFATYNFENLERIGVFIIDSSIEEIELFNPKT